VVVSGVAIATTRTKVVGLDATTGELRWEDIPRSDGPLNPPAVDASAGETGVLVFTEGDSPSTAGLVGVDLASRSQRWRLPLGDLSRSAPAVEDGVVYVGSRDRFVYAVGIDDGKLRWKVKTEASVNTAPAVADGLVFVTSENASNGSVRLYALKSTDGAVAWSYSPGRIAIGVSSATVADGLVYAGFGDATIRAFDPADGTITWTEAVRGFFSSNSTLAYANGVLYALDESGGVYRFDGKTGHRAWDYQFPAFVSWSSPLVVGDTVFVGMDDGTIAGIDVSSGHLVWQTRLRFGPVGGMAPAGGHLLVPSIGLGGGLIAYANDPTGVRLDRHSPTELNLPVALLNYAGGFVIMLLLILGLFRFLVRPRGSRELVPRPRPDGPAPRDESGGTDDGTSEADQSEGGRFRDEFDDVSEDLDDDLDEEPVESDQPEPEQPPGPLRGRPRRKR
jgi:outer membrane protein assembly factor BamB